MPGKSWSGMAITTGDILGRERSKRSVVGAPQTRCQKKTPLGRGVSLSFDRVSWRSVQTETVVASAAFRADGRYCFASTVSAFAVQDAQSFVSTSNQVSGQLIEVSFGAP